MVFPRIHFSVCLLLVYQFTVSALPASKNFTVVKLFPPSSKQNEAGSGLVPQDVNQGVMADQRSAFLGKKADSFRFHRPGFEHVPGSVSLESATHPGLYLRYKNYKFHLEKMKPTGVFEKDATFIERKTQTKGAAAYELFNHPGWFMCHDTSSTFGLVAKKLEIKSQEFLLGCLYMAVAQKTAKHDLKQSLKLTDMKKESGETRESVRNISGIISNDVSAENLMQKNPVNQSSKTNELNLSSKTHITAKKDEVTSKLSSNSTAGKNSSFAKIMQQESDSTLVNNSTNGQSDFKSTDKLRDANVTENVHVANVTQKPRIVVQNKTSMVAANQGKQLLRNDNKRIEDLVSNNLQNSSKLAGNANEETQVATQDQTNPNVQSAEKGTGVAKQTALAFGQGIASLGAKINPQYKGDTLSFQKNQKGLPAPFAPKQAANANPNMQPNQFTVHLEFPNEKHYPNGTLAHGKPPGATSSQLAKISAQATAAALGFIQNALQNPRPQQTLKYTKAGVNFPFQQQQRQSQQKHFQRPVTYVNQQMRPQGTFRAPPNYIYAPAPFSPRRPLVNPLAVKGPNSQFAYQQFKTASPQQLFNNGYSYQYPRKGWSGLVSVGKQSLVGNSASFHGSVRNKPNVLVNKSKAKLEDETPSTNSEEKDKCISLKFMNRVRKPIKLISSMKLGGYLVTAETFKLKTVFKHPRKHHHVIFYARDADDRDNEVLLNNNNAIAVTPGGCDLPFRSVIMSHHGQINSKEIEHIREEEEYKASMEAARKAVHGKEDENFTQWTAFGPCSTTCGRSKQTRTRSCKPGKICKGQAIESRTCIQTPCPVSACRKTYSGKCCALPFVFHGAVVNRCLVDPHTRRSWCATTPNFDKEKRWGYCQPAGPHTEQVAPVNRSFLPGSPRQSQCPQACARICMRWCQQRCCVPSAQR